MDFYHMFLGGVAIYRYSKDGIYWYHVATTTTATLYYINSWYKYFTKTNNHPKIITVKELDDNWLEIKNIK